MLDKAPPDARKPPPEGEGNPEFELLGGGLDEQIAGDDEHLQVFNRKARDLAIGNCFRIAVFGEVVEVEPIADGKRIRIRLALANQRQLEFETRCVEFLSRPGRPFLLYS